jgi:hypothetical protein
MRQEDYERITGIARRLVGTPEGEKSTVEAELRNAIETADQGQAKRERVARGTTSAP